MYKNTFKKEALAKGEISVYDFGEIKLHAYKTNDLIDDEVFIIEKSGNAVIIEAPCFFDNIAELTGYLADKSLKPCAMLLSYHMAGASFLKEATTPVYATANADAYGHTGGGAALIKNFTAAFGDSFDSSIFTVTNVIDGDINLCGIDFKITPTNEAFDIEIPQIGAVYTHMMGHDCHSIVAGESHAKAIISQLEGYIAGGCNLILTSHYTPENLKDAQVKIDYLKELIKISGECKNADEFKKTVNKKFPNYSGGNYLDMTAGFFFG